MPVITLTTDLGTGDYYLGIVKGELLKAIPEAQIIDISNDIEAFSTMHGAFVLRNSYHHFPKGTIHLVGVNSFHDQQASTIIVKHDGYFFVGHDNGLFGLVWDEVIPKEIYRVTLSDEELSGSLPLGNVFGRVAKHLSEGKNPEEIGTKISSFRIMTLGKPIISASHMKGTIVYFDRFGNAMVNIHKAEFERTRNGRNFFVIFKRYNDIESVSNNYSSVDESEKLCFFNSGGYLEIAINKGSARNLLNLSIGDFVMIEFQG